MDKRSVAAGKILRAGGFEIIPVCDQKIMIAESGGFCRQEPVGLILVSGENYFEVSLTEDDSWIEKLQGT